MSCRTMGRHESGDSAGIAALVVQELAAGRPGLRPPGRRGCQLAPPGAGSRAAAGGPAGTRSALARSALDAAR
jgi:hypothetical protein